MKTLLTLALLFLETDSLYAQVDTTSYPTERREIRELLRRQKPATPIDCHDFIAVGPKGDISFSHQQWVEVQKKKNWYLSRCSPFPAMNLSTYMMALWR